MKKTSKLNKNNNIKDTSEKLLKQREIMKKLNEWFYDTDYRIMPAPWQTGLSISIQEWLEEAIYKRFKGEKIITYIADIQQANDLFYCAILQDREDTETLKEKFYCIYEAAVEWSEKARVTIGYVEKSDNGEFKLKLPKFHIDNLGIEEYLGEIELRK